MDPDEAPPPPYSAVDPLLARSTSNRNATSSSQNVLHLRGGDASLHRSTSEPPTAPPGSPAHFISAAAYFVERPPPAIENGQQTLEHHMTIYPRSQSKDFPRRPRCWSPRTEHITQQDWDMFLRHLFPPHLGLASSSAELPRQVRAEIQRDRKDRPQETDDERERRITAVVAEWNEYFFEPRAARVVFFYVTDPRNAPLSPLCPRCYPAATRASQGNRNTQTPEAGGGHALSPNTPLAAAGYPQSPAYLAHPHAPYGSPNSAANPVLYPPPQGTSGFYHPANPYGYHYPSPYQHYPQWGWAGQQYHSQQESSSLKGGPLGWIAALAAQAQKYGERITEQAQQYGDQISAHAQHYGRQVEESAMAHGRWIEEQAGLHGRKVETAFTGWPSNAPQYPAYYYPPNVHAPHNASISNNTQQTAQPAPPAATTTTMTRTTTQRSRRVSVGSNSSESSLSSIDSLSTTSELSSSDLATVRAQLLSLDDHHDRDLYEAAVELRRQLENLRESRRQARISTRSRWGHGWGHRSRNDCPGRSSWGRWESPQDRQRNQAERRAAKEELRATRKAFRDVVRRAREEQREQRRMKRNRRRQERRSRRGQEQQQQQQQPGPDTASLEQRLQNLELETSREDRSAAPSTTTLPPTQRRTADSESSAASSVISTPTTESSQEDNDAEDKQSSRRCK